jgi:small ligand-binding sensory domain FIST
MKWASASSDQASIEAALDEVAQKIGDRLGTATADLGLLFVSPHHRDHFDALPALLAPRLTTRTLIGCSAGAVIGGGIEVEERPGLSLTVASLPGVTLEAQHFEEPQLDPAADGAHWRRQLGLALHKPSAFVVLADPFSFDAQPLIAALDRHFPGSSTCGGLVSGAQLPGQLALFCNDQVARTGAVILTLRGNLVVDAIVAQGCRPIDRPYFVTRCEENILFEIDGRPVLSVLREIHQRLSPRDKELFRTQLFVGVAMRDQTEEYQIGDFLVRDILGMDPVAESATVGSLLEKLMVVQFHLRDAVTSDAELDALLLRHARKRRPPAAGALLFSCLGRGQGLYGHPNHDSDLFCRRLGDVPLGGFFCNGELGPVGGRTFLHGYTSAFALFRPRAVKTTPR